MERGLQGFNTNLVAEVAGVNVGTVYHYFPDKNSILRELFQRAEEVRLSYFAGRMAELQTTHDVRGWVEDVVRGILRLRRTNPSTAVLRRSIRVIPELMELENSTTAADVQVLSKAIRHRYSHVSAARAKSVAEVIIVMSAAILDRVDDATFTAATAAREVTVVVSSYLGSLDT